MTPHAIETAARYAALKTAGLCPMCGHQPPAHGFICCERCLTKGNLRETRTYMAVVREALGKQAISPPPVAPDEHTMGPFIAHCGKWWKVGPLPATCGRCGKTWDLIP